VGDGDVGKDLPTNRRLMRRSPPGSPVLESLAYVLQSLAPPQSHTSTCYLDADLGPVAGVQEGKTAWRHRAEFARLCEREVGFARLVGVMDHGGHERAVQELLGRARSDAGILDRTKKLVRTRSSRPIYSLSRTPNGQRRHHSTRTACIVAIDTLGLRTEMQLSAVKSQ
jgi:hypothetical protein